MFSQTATLPHMPAAPWRIKATQEQIANRSGIAIALLLHLLALLLFIRQVPQPLATAAPAAAKTLTVFTLPFDSLARQASLPAAPAELATPQPAIPPQPMQKPRPRIKPAPVAPQPDFVPTERHLITADTAAAPAESAAAAPAAEPTPAAPSAASAASLSSAVSVEAGELGAQQSSISPQETDRLERQYAMLLSRTISANQHYLTEHGKAMVRLLLARDGRVLDATVVGSSGYANVDSEARSVMMRIGRFAPIPAKLRPYLQTIEILQPLSFGDR